LSDFSEHVRRLYRKDFWAGQSHYLEVWCEKDALAGVLHRETYEFDVPLRVIRGYGSVSYLWEAASLWREITKPIFVYYLGDHDPSGHDLQRDAIAKMERYSGKRFSFTRLAVLPEDIADFGLLPLAVKCSDSRARSFMAKHGQAAVEVDALPARELRRRVRESILEHIDQNEWERLKAVEEAERQTLEAVADSLKSGSRPTSRTGDRKCRS
jgi:hypothetical protein